jgi:predicted DNA binding CopG/RHH family protein
VKRGGITVRNQREESKPKLTQFKSVDDIANFFDHTDTQGLDWEDSGLKFERPEMANISVRIPKEDLLKIKKNAVALGIGYTALIRMIIHQYAKTPDQ